MCLSVAKRVTLTNNVGDEFEVRSFDPIEVGNVFTVIQVDTPKVEPIPPNSVDVWEDDKIQFPRLIAEIEAAGGFSGKLLVALLESMDLQDEQDLFDLVERAQNRWDKIKSRTGIIPKYSEYGLELSDGGVIEWPDPDG